MNNVAATRGTHNHMWLVGVVGLAAGLALMIYVPSLEVVAQSLFWLAGFHVIGGVVVLGSVYATAGRKLRRKAGKLDFGWSPAWIVGPLLLSIVLLASAMAVILTAPTWWPLSIALSLLAANAFAGFLVSRSAAQADHAALPMVDLLPTRRGLVLDAGCGAGRTTVAVARGYAEANIVSLDRFDAGYIEGGGRALYDHNTRIAVVETRVRAQQGDITAMPFEEGSFDAAVSAHAADHLGNYKETGLREIRRVLKLNGRFLLVVWVPGWSMFAVANVLSFALSSRGYWRALVRKVGFDIVEEGHFNGHFYLLLSKPGTVEVGRV